MLGLQLAHDDGIFDTRVRANRIRMAFASAAGFDRDLSCQDFNWDIWEAAEAGVIGQKRVNHVSTSEPAPA